MRKIILILLIGVATAFVFVSKGAVYGDSISVMEKKINLLKDQNQELELEIASLTSFSKVLGDSPEAIFSLSTKDSSDFSVALKR